MLGAALFGIGLGGPVGTFVVSTDGATLPRGTPFLAMTIAF